MLSQQLSRPQTEPSPVSTSPQDLSTEARARDQEQGPWTDKINNKPELKVYLRVRAKCPGLSENRAPGSWEGECIGGNFRCGCSGQTGPTRTIPGVAGVVILRKINFLSSFQFSAVS